MFDPKSAKLLKPGESLVIKSCPGLRLVASKKKKSWTYRYGVGTDAKTMKQFL